MSVVKFPKGKRTTAAPGDLVAGIVMDETWGVALVETVDDEGFVATIRDQQGVAAFYRVFDVSRHSLIAAAATLTDEGRRALIGLSGPVEALKVEFRKYATEAAGQAWEP